MIKISNKLRELVAVRAKFCCEYCLIPEKFLATTFHIDHIVSQKHGGLTEIDNLAFSCPHCNQNKGSDIGTILKDDKFKIIRLYNPRIDTWDEHFLFDYGKIEGITKIGTSTVKILEINQIERIILRKTLAEIGFINF